MRALQLEEGDLLYDLFMTELPPLIALAVTLLMGAVAFAGYRIYRRTQMQLVERTYEDRIGELTQHLTESSRRVDEVLREISSVASDRQRAVLRLEEQVTGMEKKEQELAVRIRDLQTTPIPVADHFARIVRQGEKRSARRDYILFALGAVASQVVNILFEAVRQ